MNNRTAFAKAPKSVKADRAQYVLSPSHCGDDLVTRSSPIGGSKRNALHHSTWKSLHVFVDDLAPKCELIDNDIGKLPSSSCLPYVWSVANLNCGKTVRLRLRLIWSITNKKPSHNYFQIEICTEMWNRMGALVYFRTLCKMYQIYGLENLSQSLSSMLKMMLPVISSRSASESNSQRFI